MREIRTSGSEGGGIETNRCSLPLFAFEGTEQERSRWPHISPARPDERAGARTVWAPRGACQWAGRKPGPLAFAHLCDACPLQTRSKKYLNSNFAPPWT